MLRLWIDAGCSHGPLDGQVGVEDQHQPMSVAVAEHLQPNVARRRVDQSDHVNLPPELNNNNKKKHNKLEGEEKANVSRVNSGPSLEGGGSGQTPFFECVCVCVCVVFCDC